jgi:hypothetical protein
LPSQNSLNRHVMFNPGARLTGPSQVPKPRSLPARFSLCITGSLREKLGGKGQKGNSLRFPRPFSRTILECKAVAERHNGLVPMPVALWFLGVAEDVRINLPTIRVAGYLARRADESGAIGLDENGRPVAEPRTVAAMLGLGESTVFKSLHALDRHGFIAWQKASTHERFEGVTGRVRLNLPDLKSA